jgi:uncharacterized protein (TIGR04255 family)
VEDPRDEGPVQWGEDVVLFGWPGQANVGYSTVAMASVRHLRKAPITEAIVDFRIMPSGDFQPDSLLRASALVGPDYPKMHRPQAKEARVDFREGTAAASVRDLGFTGLWLQSQDEKTVAQFRPDGFTLNRLKPYTTWEQISAEALRLWAVYVDLTKPQTVTRLALRYINHLNLPGPVADLAPYIVEAPRLPGTTPGIITTFSSHLALEYPEGQMKANVLRVLETSIETTGPSLLFDIDVYRPGPIDPRGDVLREALLGLRDYKNRIFFEGLTERFVRDFE